MAEKKPPKVKSSQSVHWNGHLLCAVDIETTGLDFEKDDLLEIAIVPLNPNLTPSKVLTPFDLVITPRDPEVYKTNQILLPGMTLSDVMLQGFDWSVAAELLEAWKERLNLPEGKKIIPLGHNYRGFDEKWMRATLGNLTYEYIFDYHVRDTMEMGLFLNDVADYLQEPIPFPKVDLTYMCSCLRVQNMRRHRALGDAVATAELYRLMVTRLAPSLIATSKMLQCPIDDLRIWSAAHKGLAGDRLMQRTEDLCSGPHQMPASEALSPDHEPPDVQQLEPLSPSPQDQNLPERTPTDGEP